MNEDKDKRIAHLESLVAEAIEHIDGFERATTIASRQTVLAASSDFLASDARKYGDWLARARDDDAMLRAGRDRRAALREEFEAIRKLDEVESERDRLRGALGKVVEEWGLCVRWSDYADMSAVVEEARDLLSETKGGE